MSATNFSGPVVSAGGFTGDLTGSPKVTVTTTAALPAAATNQGKIMMITDDGVGDDETALVVSDGSSWLKITTTALT